MTASQRGTYFALASVGAAAALLAFGWYSKNAPAQIDRFVPREAGSVIELDVAQLRQLGLLSNRTIALDAEYREFVTATGFDFERDLDQLVLHLSPQRNTYIASGRFRWDRLRNYATANGGQCVDRACSIPSSQPGKSVSFFPLAAQVIGVTLSADPFAASRLSEGPPQKLTHCPADAPVRIQLRPEELRGWNVALDAIRYARACLGPGPGGAKLRMNVVLPSPTAAAQLESAFRTLATKLQAEQLTRQAEEFQVTWSISASALESWFGGAL